MHVIPYIVAYLSLAVFMVAVVARFRMFAKLPKNLRWELYPVAHEGKKSGYGGSYMEDFEWWKGERESSLLGEMKVMVPEILFLEALHHHNPRMWYSSFPFHFGLYLVIGCTVLMMLDGLLALAAPAAIAGGFGVFLDWTIRVLGLGGLVLGLLGALGLLTRRLTASDLKTFTTPADLFNLCFFIAAFGVSLWQVQQAGWAFTDIGAFVANLVGFKLAEVAAGGTILPTSVILLSLLLAYIPLTHMSHFVGKYFAYHAIRWDDEPNTPGSGANSVDMLGKPVGWSAPHIQGEGENKTWAEAATETLPKDEEK